MKIKFKFIGCERKISANDYNPNSILPTHSPVEFVMSFLEYHTGSMRVDITVDETHRLAAFLAEQNQNQIFEFDFAQPMPEKRLNA